MAVEITGAPLPKGTNLAKAASTTTPTTTPIAISPTARQIVGPGQMVTISPTRTAALPTSSATAKRTIPADIVQNVVKLSTGEYVSKTSFGDLTSEQQNYLMRFGVDAFNAESQKVQKEAITAYEEAVQYAAQETSRQQQYNSENYVRLNNGEYVSKAEFDKLDSSQQNMLKQLGVAGFNNFAQASQTASVMAINAAQAQAEAAQATASKTSTPVTSKVAASSTPVAALPDATDSGKIRTLIEGGTTAQVLVDKGYDYTTVNRVVTTINSERSAIATKATQQNALQQQVIATLQNAKALDSSGNIYVGKALKSGVSESTLRDVMGITDAQITKAKADEIVLNKLKPYTTYGVSHEELIADIKAGTIPDKQYDLAEALKDNAVSRPELVSVFGWDAVIAADKGLAAQYNAEAAAYKSAKNDMLLGMIPGYTTYTEIQKGNIAGAALWGAIDVVTLLPVIGWAGKTAAVSARTLEGVSAVERASVIAKNAATVAKEALIVSPKAILYDMPKALVTRPLSTGAELLDVTVRPLVHPVETAKALAGIAKGDIQLGNVITKGALVGTVEGTGRTIAITSITGKEYAVPVETVKQAAAVGVTTLISDGKFAEAADAAMSVIKVGAQAGDAKLVALYGTAKLNVSDAAVGVIKAGGIDLTPHQEATIREAFGVSDAAIYQRAKVEGILPKIADGSAKGRDLTATEFRVYNNLKDVDNTKLVGAVVEGWPMDPEIRAARMTTLVENSIKSYGYADTIETFGKELTIAVEPLASERAEIELALRKKLRKPVVLKGGIVQGSKASVAELDAKTHELVVSRLAANAGVPESAIKSEMVRATLGRGGYVGEVNLPAVTQTVSGVPGVSNVPHRAKFEPISITRKDAVNELVSLKRQPLVQQLPGGALEITLNPAEDTANLLMKYPVVINDPGILAEVAAEKIRLSKIPTETGIKSKAPESWGTIRNKYANTPRPDINAVTGKTYTRPSDMQELVTSWRPKGFEKATELDVLKAAADFEVVHKKAVDEALQSLAKVKAVSGDAVKSAEKVLTRAKAIGNIDDIKKAEKELAIAKAPIKSAEADVAISQMQEGPSLYHTIYGVDPTTGVRKGEGIRVSLYGNTEEEAKALVQRITNVVENEGHLAALEQFGVGATTTVYPYAVPMAIDEFEASFKINPVDILREMRELREQRLFEDLSKNLPPDIRARVTESVDDVLTRYEKEAVQAPKTPGVSEGEGFFGSPSTLKGPGSGYVMKGGKYWKEVNPSQPQSLGQTFRVDMATQKSYVEVTPEEYANATQMSLAQVNALTALHNILTGDTVIQPEVQTVTETAVRGTTALAVAPISDVTVQPEVNTADVLSVTGVAGPKEVVTPKVSAGTAPDILGSLASSMTPFLTPVVVTKGLTKTRPVTRPFVMPDEVPGVVPATVPEPFKAPIPHVITTPSPIPSPVPTPTPVPVPVPTPTPVPVPTPIPVPTPVPSPVPVPIPVPSPVPVPVPTPIPTPVPVPTPIPTPIPVPVPTPIPTPTPVPPVVPMPIPPIVPVPPITPGAVSTRKGTRVVLPRGTVAWKQGFVWRAITPPYMMSKPLVLKTAPHGAEVLEGTPQDTLVFIGGLVPYRDISFDLGVTDGYIDVVARKIIFTGRGLTTDVGRRISGNTTGVSIEATNLARANASLALEQEALGIKTAALHKKSRIRVTKSQEPDAYVQVGR